MLDNVLKVFALATFIVFVAILAVRVPSPSLVAVLLIVVAMAVYDFLVRPYRLRDRNRS
jgi:hypothetical protein